MIYVLEEIFKSSKSQNSEQVNLRVQRGLSWLKKALLMEQDADLQFMSFGIAFNALVAQNSASLETNSKQHGEFLAQMYELDQDAKIKQIINGKASSAIEYLLKFSYASQAYWDYQNQKISKKMWNKNIEQEQQYITEIRTQHDAKKILQLLFHRISTLKVQLLNGGIHHNSLQNREAIQHSCTVYKTLLPTFLLILLENTGYFVAQKPFYPMRQLS